MDNSNMNQEVDKKEMRKYYAQTGWKLALSGVVIFGLQLLVQLIIGIITAIFPSFKIDQSYAYVLIVVGDALGILLFYLLNLKSEKSTPEPKKMKFGWWFVIYLCSFGIMGVGNIIGLIVSAIIMLPLGFGINDLNAAANLLTGDLSWTYIIFGIFVAGIIGPILEELLFRKLFMDHFLKYGIGPAVLCSGLFFGLFHGNFSQFFYAFGLGIVLAYVYAVTGKVKYTIAIHIGINILASGVMMVLLKLVDQSLINEITDLADRYLEQMLAPEKFTQMVTALVTDNIGKFIIIILYVAFILFYYFLMFLGVVLAIIFAYKFFKFRKTLNIGVKGSKVAALFNFGTLAFYIMAIVLFGITYVPMFVMGIVRLIQSFAN